MSKMSASRISCLLRCPREYAYKYILEVPQAPAKPLLYGKAFHAMLEGKAPELADLAAMDADYPWGEALKIMLAGYKKAAEPLPAPLAREIHFETDRTQGYIDEVRVGDDARWYICENKTASKLSPIKRALLPRDVQMLCYVGHLCEISQQLWLDPLDFGGVYYLQTLKPMERKKVKETPEQFAGRLTSSTEVWTYLPKEFDRAHERFEVLQQFGERRAEEVHSVFDVTKTIDHVPHNTAQCERFGNRCPYFTQCHGEVKDDAE
jgi:hypothetical protein